MILPNKITHPSESLLFISKFILKELLASDALFDDLYDLVKKQCPKKLSLERFILCLNFLFIVGRVEVEDETIKAKLK